MPIDFGILGEYAPFQDESEVRQYFQHKPQDSVICFDLLIQFVDRCKKDNKDATLFRNAATYIACGCSVDGKSNSPAYTPGTFILKHLEDIH